MNAPGIDWGDPPRARWSSTLPKLSSDTIEPETDDDVRADLADALSRVRQLEVLLTLETQRANDAERLLGILTEVQGEAIAVLRRGMP